MATSKLETKLCAIMPHLFPRIGAGERAWRPAEENAFPVMPNACAVHSSVERQHESNVSD